MFRFSINLNIEKPKWWYKLFPCKHEIWSVETNPFSRYGTKESFLYCPKCGRQAMEINRNCKHEENAFGRCIYCHERLSKFPDDHQHKWTHEPDTNDDWCEICGEWKDES